MRHFHLKRNKYYCPVINVERLWEMVPVKVRDEAAKRDDGKVPVLDLVRRVSATRNEKGVDYFS